MFVPLQVVVVAAADDADDNDENCLHTSCCDTLAHSIEHDSRLSDCVV